MCIKDSQIIYIFKLNVYLVPGHVGGGFDHVVAVEHGKGLKGDSSGYVSNLIDANLLEPSVGVGRLGGFHLVDGNIDLLDSEGVGEQGVLSGLAILGDTRLKLTSIGGDDLGDI